jgi:hypothetical protein
VPTCNFAARSPCQLLLGDLLRFSGVAPLLVTLHTAPFSGSASRRFGQIDGLICVESLSHRAGGPRFAEFVARLGFRWRSFLVPTQFLVGAFVCDYPSHSNSVLLLWPSKSSPSYIMLSPLSCPVLTNQRNPELSPTHLLSSSIKPRAFLQPP